MICATNQDLLAHTKNGRFRPDLYYRVNVFTLILPSLMELGIDIEGLVLHLLKSFRYQSDKVPHDVLQMIKGYNWPGNIRELKNVLERALMLSQGGILKPSHFAGLELQNADGGLKAGVSSIEAEMMHIKDVMRLRRRHIFPPPWFWDIPSHVVS